MRLIRASFVLLSAAVFTCSVYGQVSNALGLSSPGLTPSLDCSACEVTAREIYYGYRNRSTTDRYHGSELEVIEVLETACKTLNKYILAQESFGAHLKVFADPTVKFDIQN